MILWFAVGFHAIFVPLGSFYFSVSGQCWLPLRLCYTLLLSTHNALPQLWHVNFSSFPVWSRMSPLPQETLQKPSVFPWVRDLCPMSPQDDSMSIKMPPSRIWAYLWREMEFRIYASTDQSETAVQLHFQTIYPVMGSYISPRSWSACVFYFLIMFISPLCLPLVHLLPLYCFPYTWGLFLYIGVIVI